MQAAGAARALFSLCYKDNMQLETVLVLQLLADIHKVSMSRLTCVEHCFRTFLSDRSCVCPNFPIYMGNKISSVTANR